MPGSIMDSLMQKRCNSIANKEALGLFDNKSSVYDLFSSQLFIIYLSVCRYLSQRSPVIVYRNEGALSSSISGLVVKF